MTHSVGAYAPCYTAPMEFDLPSNPSTNKRRPWMEVTLVAGFLFSLVLGLAALGALFVLRDDGQTPLTAPPLQTIQPDQIVPQLALAELAGDPAEALAYQSAAAGELDTARAIMLFAAGLPGSQRLALLLRLGRRFLEEQRAADAATFFNLARAVSALDPAIDTSERSLGLVQAANGLLEAEENEAALDAAVQAMRVAEQMPGLLPAQRSQILESLRPLARQLDDPAFSQQIAELARNPYIEATGVALVSRWAGLAASPLFDADVQAAIEQRQLAARLLADRLILTNGIDIDPETQALASALLAEDQIRSEFYRRSLTSGLSLEQQFALLQDRRAWAALKLRVALRGFGSSLVPEWEQIAAQLEQELAAATANLISVVEAQISAFPDPTDQAMLRTEALLWQAQQMELGLYPGASPTDLDGQLNNAQMELSRLGSPPALPAAYEAGAIPPGFRIQSTR